MVSYSAVRVISVNAQTGKWAFLRRQNEATTIGDLHDFCGME